jgi:hypothetical protein
MIAYQFVLFDFLGEKKIRTPILYSSSMPRKRRKRKKKEGCKKHQELEKREEKESIRKNLWVHPIQGNEKYRVMRRRYLCITDPYEDPKEWAKQLKYWKEMQELKLKGPEKLVRVLYFRRINPKHSPRKVRLLQEGKQFTFPIECLVRNRRQKRFEIVNKK